MIAALAIDSILHASDFSAASQRAFEHALKLALACRAELLIAHVDPPGDDSSWLEYPGVRRTLQRWGVMGPQASEGDVARLGLTVEKVQLAGDNPVDELLNLLDDYPVDFAVLARHPRPWWQRWRRPEVALPVARRSQTATLFVPEGCAGFVAEEDGAVRLARVLAPIDHSPDPQWVVSISAGFLQALGCKMATIDLVHVGDAGRAPHVQLPQQPGWTWRTQAVQGDVIERLTHVAEELRPDLVVLGTAGRRGLLDALRGSTSERLIHALSCPVLAASVTVNP